MSFTVEDKSRIGRGTYWAYFGAQIVVATALVVALIAAAVSLHFAAALLCLAALLVTGIYFRVIMMRRCRDIGWPAFVPWLMLGLAMAANYSVVGMAARGHGAPSMSLVPLLVGLADLGVMITIGCIQSKSVDYSTFYEPSAPITPASRDAVPLRVQAPLAAQPARPVVAASRPEQPAAVQPLAPSSEEEASWDAAIARALAMRGGAAEVPDPAERAVHRPVAPLRAAGGFGRRVV